MSFNLWHYLFPQESNNFRAKSTHPSAFIFYITVFVVLQVGFNILSFVKPGVLGYATNISIDRLLEQTNQRRNELGLNSLALNNELAAAANNKANDMFTNNYWAHNSPQGASPWDFILGAGYHYIYAGENLAKDFADSDGVVAAWMASPTHKDNMVNPKYTDIGFSVVNGKLNGMETTLVVQMFGSKAPTAPIANVPETTKVEAINEEISITPTLGPEPTIVKEVAEILKPSPRPTNMPVVLAVNLNKKSSTNPLLKIFSLTKQFSLGLVILLIIVLAIDGYVALRDKSVRITGDRLAHIGFLIILILAVLATTVGMII